LATVDMDRPMRMLTTASMRLSMRVCMPGGVLV
jgi:hypothetical protein